MKNLALVLLATLTLSQPTFAISHPIKNGFRHVNTWFVAQQITWSKNVEYYDESIGRYASKTKEQGISGILQPGDELLMTLPDDDSPYLRFEASENREGKLAQYREQHWYSVSKIEYFLTAGDPEIERDDIAGKLLVTYPGCPTFEIRNIKQKSTSPSGVVPTESDAERVFEELYEKDPHGIHFETVDDTKFAWWCVQGNIVDGFTFSVFSQSTGFFDIDFYVDIKHYETPYFLESRDPILCQFIGFYIQYQDRLNEIQSKS